ncbi:hypothetical protein O2W18_15385 [Modestobacter sp. VKM Ac-2983]|uniref:DUF6541 family protein n=1 Tax=Modestobacter sp. VKM Ac-2983 TaxID=3004137 RepID=UPI0022AB86F9|nr:DUF6541 family protein [Modestobacter sp. VKM Ac-2983]MCZ2806492.1 hypothetical protein [Modestobacter sp. VKM Ac-2983]
MSWLGSVLVVALCVVCLVVPGLPIAHLLGLRGLAAVGLAPVAVVGVVGVTAIGASQVGVEWSPLLLLAVFAGLTALVACIALPLRQRLPRPLPADRRSVLGAASAGLVAAMLLGAFTVRRAIASPEELIQSSDSPFHYNAVVTILNSGDASSFALDTLGVPGQAQGFYPGAWHGLASLLVMMSGVSVPAAANILSVSIALVVWPLGCLLLMRQLAGPSPLALGLAGVLSIGFGAFPWELLGWGVLWPNLLGLALVPAGLATLLSAVGLAEEDVIGRWRAWCLLPVMVVAIGLAHPNAVISLSAIAVAPTAVALGRAARRRYRAGDRPCAVLLAAPLLLAAPAYWLVVAESGLFDRTMEADSPPFESPSHAIGEVLTGATNGWGAGWVLAALVVVGAVSTFVHRRRRWLVASHLVAGGLYVLAAGVPGAGRRIFTGFWYTDSHRLAAILPVTAVPLAVTGLLALIALAQARVGALADRRALGGAPRWSALVVPAALGLLLLASVGLYSTDNRDRVLAAYPKVDPLVDQAEYDLFTRAAEHVEPGAVIAQMPLNGSPAVMALSRRQVLFPQINTGRVTPDQMYLAQHLVDAATDPEVCRIADRLDVRYLLTNDRPWGTVWDGLTYPGASSGFELLDEGGTFDLYRLTACDTAPGAGSGR